MRIGGVQPSSFIDFPGTVSAVIFTVGCNFRCPYCHNPELVFESPDHELSGEEVLSFLETRAGLLPAVTITGGEPTMQQDLLPFMRKVKRLGFRLKLDTNGTNPEVLREAIKEKLLDYVAMDVKAPLSKYARVVASAVNTRRIAESISILLEGAVEYEFRTTIVRSQLELADLEIIGQEIRGAKRYFLQKFNPAKTLHPSFHNYFSYSPQELQDAAQALRAYVQSCEVRS